ncbi:Integral membrane protein [Pleurostoma richardsiae]|uniref:Integral membrane protein n=1 Tax=Pleurostoma richardsiae TaxID=41990 RepID=A0AA38S8B5_9PEZI|nr:Integral membrane protein [Pleurostoma richardsiae]
MQIPPLSTLASWPAPNYVDPETRGPANAIVISILLSSVTVLLGVRLYSRLWISHGFGVDDILIALAYVPATAFAIIGIVSEYSFGWNRHAWDLPTDLITPGLKLSLATQVLFDVATTLTKLSMLTLIFKIMAAGQSRMRHAVLILAILIALDGFIFIFVTIFQCSPVSAYWTLSFTPQKCIDEATHVLAAGIINTVTDFIIVLLPIPTVARLGLPPRQLAVVLGLFGGGLLSTAAGAVRTFFTWRMIKGADHDITWYAYVAVLTSAIELYVGIICASLPATKPFFSRYLPRLLGATVPFSASWPHPTRQSEPLAEQAWWSAKHSQSSILSFHNVGSPPGPPPLPPQQLGREKPLPAAPDLNKPLPSVRTAMSLAKSLSFAQEKRATATTVTSQAGVVGAAGASGIGDRQTQMEDDAGRAPRNESVYQFIPYEDGHISVHKARGNSTTA